MRKLYLMLMVLFALPIVAQTSFDEFRKQQQADFDKFKKDSQEEYDAFRKKMNEEYAEFMRQAWKAFPAHNKRYNQRADNAVKSY